MALSPKKRGPKPHIPNESSRNAVLHYCGLGMTQPQICQLMGFSRSTLVKNYRHELDVGEAKMTINVANNLYSMATDRDHRSSAASAMFWMKARAGWRETNRTEVTGANGGAIKTEGSAHTIDASQLSPEQRDALRQMILSVTHKKADNVIEHDDTDEDDYIDGEEYDE